MINIARTHSVGTSLICLLLGKTSADTLVIGSQLEAWSSLFSYAKHIEAHEISTEEGKYDLILIDSTNNHKTLPLRTLINVAKERLSLNGIIIFFAKNKYTLSSLNPVFLYNALSSGHSHQYYAKLFNSDDELYFKSLVASEDSSKPSEFFGLESNTFELPFYSNKLLKVFNRFDRAKYFWNDFLFVLGKEPLFNRFCSLIAESLPKLKNITISKINKIDIRQRGALVFIFEDHANSYVIRMVSEPEVLNTVERNHHFIEQLKNQLACSKELCNLIPEPIGKIKKDDITIFVESKIDGIPAWKASVELKQSIRKQAEDLIWKLQDISKKTVDRNTITVSSLLSNQMKNISQKNKTIKHYFSTVLNIICKGLEGKITYLVASHGDYGFGNIFVDRNTGSILGVIDWDTGLLEDLPGADFFNLAIQIERSSANTSLSDAMLNVLQSKLDKLTITQFKKLGFEQYDIKYLIYISILKYALRSAQYSEVFSDELDEYIIVFKKIININTEL